MEMEPIDLVVNAFRKNSASAQIKYPWFPAKYPKLYAMCTGPDFDPTVFKQLLAVKQKLDNQELSEHDASVEFGSALVDTYIKPKI
jgi:hypothetical protein